MFPTPSHRPIGIFDSGEGGLTVARVLSGHLPGENLIYACDTARFPYGPRSLPEVRAFFLEFVDFFRGQGCKLIVIACNTATAAALDLLDGRLSVPAVGVVEPGSRAAANCSANGRIGVAATQATCESGIYRQFLHRFRSGLRVLQQPCPILVLRAEEGVISGPAVRAEVTRCLQPLLDGGIDTLILGCTHFPHMQAVIADVTGPNVTLIDPAVATGFEVAKWLRLQGLENPRQYGWKRFYTSGDPQRFVEVASRLWPGGVDTARRLPKHIYQE